MKQTETVLACATLFVTVWSFLVPFVDVDFHLLAMVGGQPSSLEKGILSWHLWMARWLPYFLGPGLLAPASVAAAWAFAPKLALRAFDTPAGVGEVWRWLRWVFASIAIGAIALTLVRLGLPLRLFAVAAPLMFASSWSLAAALHTALALQARRESLQLSRIKPLYLACGSALASAIFLAIPVGVLIPLWVAWSAGKDPAAALVSDEQQS